MNNRDSHRKDVSVPMQQDLPGPLGRLPSFLQHGVARFGLLAAAALLACGTYDLALALDSNPARFAGTARIVETYPARSPALRFTIEGVPYIFCLPDLWAAPLAREAREEIDNRHVVVEVPHAYLVKSDRSGGPVVRLIGLSIGGRVIVDRLEACVEAGAYAVLMAGATALFLFGAFAGARRRMLR